MYFVGSAKLDPDSVKNILFLLVTYIQNFISCPHEKYQKIDTKTQVSGFSWNIGKIEPCRDSILTWQQLTAIAKGRHH